MYLFRTVWDNLRKFVVWVAMAKKNPAKIGRELINQGASTNLVSGSRCTCSGQFGTICENLWFGWRYQKKNPAKIGRELINQGASTN
ncbi:hypothetical protein D0A34_05220 [Microcoleus vaginatus PCC 9802]|nr:hypothetical protein D0A34_05220 [Microcoleus vaginatus PCC 9802]